MDLAGIYYSANFSVDAKFRLKGLWKPCWWKPSGSTRTLDISALACIGNLTAMTNLDLNLLMFQLTATTGGYNAMIGNRVKIRRWLTEASIEIVNVNLGVWKLFFRD